MNRNKELARILNRIADFLELKGELVYKINAYRRAARAIESISEDIEEIYKRGELYEIPGVGERIAKKIEEFIKTGTISKYEELRKEFPEELAQLLDVPYLGPKTLKLAYEKLGVKSLEDLKRVLEDGSLARLPGMGPKKVENIKKGLELYLKGSDRMLLGEALELAEYVIGQLKDYCDRISYAGSLRRMKETIGDIDILAVGNKREIMDRFVSIDKVTEVIAKGETKSSVLIGTRQVDLRVVEEDQWGAALQYFTGSKEHNVHLREIAKEKGLKINEYGVFKVASGVKIAGKTEEEVYAVLGLPYIPPELREDRGEIEAALEGRLPEIVPYEGIKGDFHVHSNWSDGGFSIEEIARAAKSVGLKFVAITDHSKSVKIAHGLDEERLLKQIEEIDRLNKQLKGFKILKGIEVDILPDGSLDLSDEVLSKLDWVVASVHSRFNEDATERILSAMRNPYVTCIGHPSGRMLFQREGYPVDWERVFEEAARTGTCLEINAHQDRLDLTDVLARKAKEFGVKFAIGTDSHHIGQFWMLRLGVGVARRGWLTVDDVLNYWDLRKIRAFINKKRRRLCQ
ncbi:DNA polymerase, family X [Thermosulfidibacter takaii ABI70S6]|uniref:DNA polymerase beta n=1 Tax=Thermosulfidibacter takaii (strain DSM 17441 / JCM 13301 / NBRC 103674 / ABI70S6) TaxID=1298851 RepID=A0A0S3QUT4_THET7|nr:DNA polymerase/3'-5' exonuclease PolX [Thermosulfidibacter takaii]BAT72096.1 DNA polymerase, family X [Thermosulfidibacter takaii ABI70S6]